MAGELNRYTLGGSSRRRSHASLAGWERVARDISKMTDETVFTVEWPLGGATDGVSGAETYMHEKRARSSTVAALAKYKITQVPLSSCRNVDLSLTRCKRVPAAADVVLTVW